LSKHNIYSSRKTESANPSPAALRYLAVKDGVGMDIFLSLDCQGEEIESKKGGEEVRLTSIVLALFMAVALASNVFGVAGWKTVEYAGASAGKVIFDGKAHADTGAKCTECHTKIFQMKKGAQITMADMNAGKNCGVCHNGEKAFKSGDPANCAKCHKK